MKKCILALLPIICLSCIVYASDLKKGEETSVNRMKIIMVVNKASHRGSVFVPNVGLFCLPKNKYRPMGALVALLKKSETQLTPQEVEKEQISLDKGEHFFTLTQNTTGAILSRMTDEGQFLKGQLLEEMNFGNEILERVLLMRHIKKGKGKSKVSAFSLHKLEELEKIYKFDPETFSVIKRKLDKSLSSDNAFDSNQVGSSVQALSSSDTSDKKRVPPKKPLPIIVRKKQDQNDTKAKRPTRRPPVPSRSNPHSTSRSSDSKSRSVDKKKMNKVDI